MRQRNKFGEISFNNKAMPNFTSKHNQKYTQLSTFAINALPRQGFPASGFEFDMPALPHTTKKAKVARRMLMKLTMCRCIHVY